MHCSLFYALHNSFYLEDFPGALVFHRDMFLDIPIIAGLDLLQQQCQVLMEKNLMQANCRPISHDYQPNSEEVLLLAYKPNTLYPQATDPFTIPSVHANGTITINHNPYVRERISIQHVRPYYRE
jgi:hypothetical protein